MTSSKPFSLRRGLRWFLAAVTFLAVLATAAGCASRCPACRAGGPDSDPHATGAGRPQIWADEAPADGAQTPDGVVNVFGEFGRNGRNGPVRPVGEAGFQQHTDPDEGEDSGVSVDPTGRWMVYSSTRHSEHPDLYLQRVDGSSVTQLTNDTADDAFPSFSPDGKKIAFCSTRSGTWQVYVMDADGHNAVQLTTGRTQCIHPSFAPDGKRVAYSSLGARSNQWEIWTANVENGEQRMVGYGLFPSWSPRKDVDRIAFQRARQRGSRWFSLWTIDLVEGEGRRPTEVAVSPVAAIVTPSWSPDGRRLAFATVIEPASDWGGKPSGQQDVWTIGADGTNRQRLTDGSGSNLMPCWASDGRVYFISDRDGRECVWSVSAGGKTETLTADTKEVGRD